MTKSREDAIVAAALELTNTKRAVDEAIKDAERTAKKAEEAYRRAVIEQANYADALEYSKRALYAAEVAQQNYYALVNRR